MCPIYSLVIIIEWFDSRILYCNKMQNSQFEVFTRQKKYIQKEGKRRTPNEQYFKRKLSTIRFVTKEDNICKNYFVKKKLKKKSLFKL